MSDFLFYKNFSFQQLTRVSPSSAAEEGKGKAGEADEGSVGAGLGDDGEVIHEGVLIRATGLREGENAEAVKGAGNRSGGIRAGVPLPGYSKENIGPALSEGEAKDFPVFALICPVSHRRIAAS